MPRRSLPALPTPPRARPAQADGDRESAIVRSQGDAAKAVLDAESFRTSVVNRAKVSLRVARTF